MISIKGLIKPFRRSFDPESINDRSRLCEAFELLDDNVNKLTGSDANSKHYTKAFSNVGLNIPTGVATALLFNAETSSNGGMHSTTTLNTRFTITRAGLYTIIANVQWPAFAVAAIPLTLQIKVNGATLIASRIDYSQAAPLIQDQLVMGSDYFNIGDYIEIFVTQTSGGVLVIPVVANFSPYVMVMEN
jgi:hypothetical protein